VKREGSLRPRPPLFPLVPGPRGRRRPGAGRLSVLPFRRASLKMDQKNFIVAIVLSVVIILGWQTLFPPTHPTPPQQQTPSQSGQPNAPAGGQTGGQPGAPQAPA